MKKNKTTGSKHRSDIEKKRLAFDLAYCDSTYDSKEGRDRCYLEATDTNTKRAGAGA